jgi:ribosomal protein L40E
VNVVEALCNNLCQSGIDAAVNLEKKSLLSQLSPFGAKSIGKINLRGTQFEEIELFGHFDKPNQKSFGASARSSLEAVDLDYVMSANTKGKKKLLESRLKVKRTGLLRPKVVEMKWEGGDLAKRLNNDVAINELLWQSVGQLSARDMEVKLNEDSGKVILHIRDDKWVLASKLPPFPMYQKIADHVTILAGSSPATPSSVSVELPATISSRPDGTACDHCGHLNLPGVQICAACGFIIGMITKSTPDGLRCKKCGGMNLVDAKQCKKCGSKLEGVIPAAPPPKQSKAPEAAPSPGDGLACGKCGFPNKADSRFCAKCGTKIESAPGSKFCPRCGDPIEEDENFCDKCGKKLL